jgi:hypothetical protein
MSDARLLAPDSSDDACDDSAPTERDPTALLPRLPSRGVALSVLWWLEGDPDGASSDPQAHDQGR